MRKALVPFLGLLTAIVLLAATLELARGLTGDPQVGMVVETAGASPTQPEAPGGTTAGQPADQPEGKVAGDPGAGASEPAGTTDTTAAPSRDATAATVAGQVERRPVRIAFAGDVHAEPPIRGVLDRGANPLHFMADALGEADVAVVNLETAVSRVGTALPKTFAFNAPGSLLTALKGAGVDVVSLGNNHAMDWGAAGLADTAERARETGLEVVGAGEDADAAFAPAVIEVNGVRVAVVGIARVADPDSTRATASRPGVADGKDVSRSVKAVRDAKATADIVVVTTHMGTELARCPEPDEQAYVRKLLDAGASVVVGHHPHVLQGIEAGDGTLTAYSVGNFVFYAKNDEARQTMVLTVTVAPDGRVVDHEIVPGRIDDQGRPKPLTGSAAESLLDEIESLTPGAGTCRRS